MSKKSETTRFQPGAAHPKAIDLVARLDEIKKLSLGTLRIVGNEILRGERSRQYVDAFCGACNVTHRLNVENIVRRMRTNCRCQRRRLYQSAEAAALGERYDAILQRCTNPASQSYKNYGGRGIEVRFSRQTFIRYAEENLPRATEKGMQIDRIDNDGHYEPGNLRVVAQTCNLRNKRNNKTVTYKGKQIVAADLHARLVVDFPGFLLSPSTTAKLAANGVPVFEIIGRAGRPRHKPRSSFRVVVRSMRRCC